MTLSFGILRSDDLLAVTVEAVNLKLDTSLPARPRLVREKPAQDAYLVFGFGSQAIVEGAFFETAVPPPPNSLPLPGAVPARLAGSSRLVFRLPPALHAVDYTIAGLLDWDQLEPMLPAAATVLPGATSAPFRPPPPITEPAALETSLELPYRLIISPNLMPGGILPGWVHADEPVLHAGRAELWHTRLGRRHAGQPVTSEASEAAPVPLRAVWSPDFVADGPLPTSDSVPFLEAMSARDRDQIVILSSGFSGYTLTDPTGAAQPYVPVPVEAGRLFLSALGGWLTSRGAWPHPVSYTYTLPIITAPAGSGPSHEAAVGTTAVAALDLSEWDHVATQARDHLVRIVSEGFLFPFGHRAAQIQVTERKVLAPHGQSGNPSDSPVAYLRQRIYIVVREQEKSYQGAPYTHQGREMPLSPLVRITTRVTPSIDEPPAGATSYWVNVAGQPFQFHVTARDLAGQDVNFLAPLIFVSISETSLDAIPGVYAADNTRRRCAARGQHLAYADPSAGDTVLKTNALYFNAQVTQQQPPFPVAPFIPLLDRAEVTVPSLAALTGRQDAVLIKLYEQYLQTALDPNAGVFAEIDGPPQPVGFSADKAGGFAQPNIELTALSARKGLVAGDPGDAAEGAIDPSAYFGPPDAKLFGTVPLGDLIPIDQLTKRASAAQNAPEIRIKATPNRRHPTKLVTTISWKPELQDFHGKSVTPQVPADVLFNSDGQKSAFTLDVVITNNLDGSPPSSVATGKLTNFTLRLVDIVDLKVASITFVSRNGAKSTVTMDLAASHAISFIGPLEFVQAIASILPSGLFGARGPSIQATKTALKVSYTLGLPPITCGVFSLQHISILAGVDLPYLDGKPAVEFGFAARSRPFLLTVEIFGGGGFVHLIVDADGVQMVEGALEFGGNYAFDVGVASGGVHAMAGIYFQLKGQSSDLTGFIDIGGEVSVLGIISISLDLNLSLSWQSSPKGNIIEGRATLTVSVHILFFSASVTLSVERSFAAGGHDPGVGQLLTPQQWRDYAQAFTVDGA
jgi:hypothetical protein